MTPAGRWLEESLLTEGGRQALAEILRAVREEDPDGDAARYRRLKAALAEAMAPSAEGLSRKDNWIESGRMVI